MNKFVAVVDRNYPAPHLLNAVGHLALGMGAKIDTALGKYSTFKDSSNMEVSYLTDYPLIILGAKSSEKLIAIHEQAIHHSIIHNVYYETMFSHSVEDQLNHIASLDSKEQKYVAVLLFGDSETLNNLTKRISLYK